MKLLVEHGADLRAQDADGVTPLEAAMGKMRFGRGPTRDAHEETAAALRQLLADTAGSDGAAGR